VAARLLHVTDVLRPLYTGPADPWLLERGTAVHLACEYLDTVGLDWSTLDPQIEGYVRAWERCKAETGAQIAAVEQKIGGAHVGYVGTLDRIVMLGGAPELWDLKTGGPHASHGLQLAAYLHGIEPKVKSDNVRRRTVHLKDDGTYALVEHSGKGDLKVFLAMLTAAYWRLENGIDSWPAPRAGEAAA
jgi:hypothetical protein